MDIKAVWSALISKKTAQTQILDTPAKIDNFLRQGYNDTGTFITDNAAMRLATAYACVKVIAESVGQLPLALYKRRPTRGADEDRKHPLYEILHDSSSDNQTACEFRETLTASVLQTGNGFALINRVNGRVAELIPLEWERVTVKILSDLTREYVVTGANGSQNTYSADQIFHIPGLSLNGFTGLSPIGYAKKAFELAAATEAFGARFFGKGTNPGMIFEHPGTLSDPAFKRLKDELSEKHSGLGKSHQAMILEEGMKATPVGIPPEEAQFLETRKYQRSEIAGLYRVPLHMIGDLERATFSNIEQQSLDFVIHTLGPWLKRWEQRISKQLLTPAERAAGYYAEFKVTGFLRGDATARSNYYAKAIASGWMNPNEARALENQNPYDGGDVYRTPLNMTTAGQAKGTKGAVKTRDQATEAATAKLRRAASQCVGKEVAALTAKSGMLADPEAFSEWMTGFYADHAEELKRTFGPVFGSFAEQITAACFAEVGKGSVTAENLDAFVSSYLEAFATREVASSIGQIRTAMSAENPKSALDTTLTRWKSDRADIIAAHEAIRGGGAFAKVGYAAAGVTALKWVRRGTESCPYCKALDGRTVAIEHHFFGDGDIFQPEGADMPMKINGAKAHPPLHKGCTCTIAAG